MRHVPIRVKDHFERVVVKVLLAELDVFSELGPYNDYEAARELVEDINFGKNRAFVSAQLIRR